MKTVEILGHKLVTKKQVMQHIKEKLNLEKIYAHQEFTKAFDVVFPPIEVSNAKLYPVNSLDEAVELFQTTRPLAKERKRQHHKKTYVSKASRLEAIEEKLDTVIALLSEREQKEVRTNGILGFHRANP